MEASTRGDRLSSPLTVSPLTPLVMMLIKSILKSALPASLLLLQSLLLSAEKAPEDAEMAAALETVRQRTVEFFAGGQGRGPIRTRAVEELDAACADLLESGLPRVVWEGPGDLDIDLRLRDLTSDIRQLATAYRCPGSRFEGDPAVREEVVAGLFHALETFDPAIPRLPGSGFARWRLNMPHNLGIAALLMEADLGIALKTRLKAALAFQVGVMDLTGANGVWEARNHALLALLERNPLRLARAAEHAYAQIHYSADGGVQEDYGYVFHGRIPYAGGYGAGFADTTSLFFHLLDGTPWAASGEKRGLVEQFLLEHAQWFLENGRMDLLIQGRAYRHRQPPRAARLLEAVLCLTRTDTDRHGRLVAAAARMLQGDLPVSLELAGTADRLSGLDPVRLEGFRYWYSAEMGAYKGNGFHVGLRQFSERMQDYEYMTQLGEDGWNLAYGFANLLRTDRRGDWYGDRGNLLESLDFEYLPATTTRIGAHPENPLMPRVGNTGYSLNFGTSPLAGGTGLESGGVAGFLLEPVHGDFTARKSLHFFPDGYWALGSAINSSAGLVESRPVVTPVLQRPVGAEAVLVVNGTERPLPSGAVESLPEVQWIWVDGTGVVFRDPVSLSLRHREGVLSAWLDHGPRPAGALYAYAFLPVMEQAETAAFAADPPVLPVWHDARIHGVTNRQQRNDSLVFFEAGKAAGIKAGQPLVVYRDNGDSGSRYSVQDPLHQRRAELRLTVPETGSATLPDPEVAVGRSPEGDRTVAIASEIGRVYRFGFGEDGRKARSRPREDLAGYHDFSVKASSDARFTNLEVTLPLEALAGPFNLVLLAHKGQWLAELTDDQLADTPVEGRRVYRWDRQETPGLGGRSLTRPGVAWDFRLMLVTPMKMAVDHFHVPAFSAGGDRLDEPLQYEPDLNNPQSPRPPPPGQDI